MKTPKSENKSVVIYRGVHMSMFFHDRGSTIDEQFGTLDLTVVLS